MAAEGQTAKTRNACAGEIGTAWKLFVRHGKAKDNPWGLVRVARKREKEKTGRAFTRGEVSRLRVIVYDFR